MPQVVFPPSCSIIILLYNGFVVVLQLSKNGGSAWEWNDAKKQFYLHQFDKGEPEFNFHNPDVQSYFNVSFKPCN